MIDTKQIRKEWFIEQLDALKESGIPYSEIAKRMDVLPQYLNNIRNGDRGASEKIVLKLCEEFNINHNDLLKRLKMYEKEDFEQKDHNIEEPEDKKENKIPFYNEVVSVGGDNVRADIATPHTTPSEWVNAGDWFPGATSAIRHYGDSMVEYPSGSILVLKRVVDVRLIIWGRNYSIETTEYRVTKRLQDGGPDHFIAYSSNTDTYPDGKQIHEPFIIPKELVRHIDLVLGLVGKEF